MYDPNGIQVELTSTDKKYEEILTAKEAVVREQFIDWIVRIREQKEKIFGSEELDRREVTKWLDD